MNKIIVLKPKLAVIILLALITSIASLLIMMRHFAYLSIYGIINIQETFAFAFFEFCLASVFLTLTVYATISVVKSCH